MRSRSSPATSRSRTASFVVAAVLAVPAVLTAGCDVFSTVSDQRAPRVEIIQPAPGSAASGGNVLVRILATASGVDNHVSFVNVHVDHGRAGEALFDGAHYLYRLDTTDLSDGPHSLEAVAFDRFEARGSSADVTVTTDNERAGPGPRYEIVDPRPGEPVVGRVRVSARPVTGEAASDRVELLVDGIVADVSVRATDDIGTHMFAWHPDPAGPGEYILEVKAHAGPDRFTLSDPVNVIRSDESDG